MFDGVDEAVDELWLGGGITTLEDEVGFLEETEAAFLSLLLPVA